MNFFEIFAEKRIGLVVNVYKTLAVFPLTLAEAVESFKRNEANFVINI